MNETLATLEDALGYIGILMQAIDSGEKTIMDQAILDALRWLAKPESKMAYHRELAMRDEGLSVLIKNMAINVDNRVVPRTRLGNFGPGDTIIFNEGKTYSLTLDGVIPSPVTKEEMLIFHQAAQSEGAVTILPRGKAK